MLFLDYFYNQLIVPKRIAKQLAHDSEVLRIVELHSASLSQRKKTLQIIVRAILSLHETASVLLNLNGYLPDEQWKKLMESDVQHSPRQKSFDATRHFHCLILDLTDQGKDWAKLTQREKFIETCASTLA